MQIPASIPLEQEHSQSRCWEWGWLKVEAGCKLMPKSWYGYSGGGGGGGLISIPVVTTVVVDIEALGAESEASLYVRKLDMPPFLGRFMCRCANCWANLYTSPQGIALKESVARLQK